MSYCELEEIKKTAKHDSYLIEINKIQNNLLTKLKKLDKNINIKDFLLKYKKQYRNQKKSRTTIIIRNLIS